MLNSATSTYEDTIVQTALHISSKMHRPVIPTSTVILEKDSVAAGRAHVQGAFIKLQAMGITAGMTTLGSI